MKAYSISSEYVIIGKHVAQHWKYKFTTHFTAKYVLDD